MKEQIERLLRKIGAVAIGFAETGHVEAGVLGEFEHWLSQEKNAEMGYMRNHLEIRRDPRLLLAGGKTIITMAFDYGSASKSNDGIASIAKYALVADYHESIRKKIRESRIGDILGEELKDWRILVDSAPIMERYWAVKSGLGIRGKNGMIIVPGKGSELFLAEIITTKEIAPNYESRGYCEGCGLCIEACPTGALQETGEIDCNRCLSYLTIEHKGEWAKEDHISAMQTEAGRETLFGCDRCVRICPHNLNRENKSEFETLQGIRELTGRMVLDEKEENLRTLLRGSSLKRVGISGLKRNAANLKSAFLNRQV